MYEAGHSIPEPEELGELLRRLEAALLRHQEDLREAHRQQDGGGVELLRGGARLLAEEIERVRALL